MLLRPNSTFFLDKCSSFVKKEQTTIELPEWVKVNNVGSTTSCEQLSSLMIGVENGTATLEESLAVHYKSKQDLTMLPSDCSP